MFDNGTIFKITRVSCNNLQSFHSMLANLGFHKLIILAEYVFYHTKQLFINHLGICPSSRLSD